MNAYDLQQKLPRLDNYSLAQIESIIDQYENRRFKLTGMLNQISQPGYLNVQNYDIVEKALTDDWDVSILNQMKDENLNWYM